MKTQPYFTNPFFTKEEYLGRAGRAQQEMAKRGAELLLVDEIESFSYLTGLNVSINGSPLLILPQEGAPVMIVRKLDEGAYLERTWFPDHVCVTDWDDPGQTLARLFAERGWESNAVGVDLRSHCMTVGRYEEIKRVLPKARFVDCSSLVWDLRYRKSPAEIDYLRKAARIADEAMRAAIAAAGAGISEAKVAAAAAAVFQLGGADFGPLGIITSADRSHMMHGHLIGSTLRPGDLLHMEFIPQVAGYGARMMRPTAIGKPTVEQQDVAKRLYDIQDEQFDHMKPGVAAREVDARCRGKLLQSGLREDYANITGYTLGFYSWRSPKSSDFGRSFHPEADWPLVSGMTFHMYVSARGIGISETVLVGEGGAERLTRCERRLFVA